MKQELRNNQNTALIKATAISFFICALVFAVLVSLTYQTLNDFSKMVFCGADKAIIEFNNTVEKLRAYGKPSYSQIFRSVWPALLVLLLAEVTVINSKIKNSSANQKKTALKEIGYITLIVLIAIIGLALAGWLEYYHLYQEIS